MTTENTHKVPNVPPLRFPEFSGEWERKRIRELFAINVGGDIDKKDVNPICTEHFKYPIIANALSNDGIYGYTSVYKDKAPCITVTGRGDIGKAKYRDTPLYPIVRLLVLHSLGDVDCLFGEYAINHIRIYEESTGVPQLTAPQLGAYHIKYPSSEEQMKIGAFLSLLDKRISTQNKIIEDLKTLKSAIIEMSYNCAGEMCKIGDLIVQVSKRNKENSYPVLSVNNQLGFIEQADQFEDRTVASEDTSNYKVVSTDDFAYNPARINVGSIARLKDREKGIVSPMYVCFHTKTKLLPEYMEYFFDTSYFRHEMYKRLEGSVRLCLSYEGLCNISMLLPTIEEQKKLSNRISVIEHKIQLESKILKSYRQQKTYLLQQMFI